MWGLIVSVIGLMAWGIRSCPGLDPRDQMAMRANVPIELWCEVRDQNDIPLANEEITVRLVHRVRDENREDRNKIVLDENGRFHAQGRSHCGITLHLNPEIYLETHYLPRWYTSLLVTSLRRETIRTDWGTAEQPTICRVLRKEGPQPLTEVWGRVAFPFRSDPIYIDLRRGRITHQRDGADVEIIVDLGKETKAVQKPESPFVTDTNYREGAIYYPQQTVWVRAVDGWIEEIPRDFNWYSKYVHAALPYKPVEAVRPYNFRSDDYGHIAGQYMVLGSRNGALHAKFQMNVFTTYGPNPDVIVQFRGVVNATGSKSFEHERGSVLVRQLEIEPGMIPDGHVFWPTASGTFTWGDIFPECALSRNPEKKP